VRRVQRAGGIALAVLLITATTAIASHDWSQYYSRTKSGQTYYVFSFTDSDVNNDRHVPWHADYEYADFWIAYTDHGEPIVYPTATCSGADACEFTSTNTYSFPTFTHFWLRAAHCGKDVYNGTTHRAPTNYQNLSVCSPQGIGAYLVTTSWDY
jgi:hypothetical protein